MKLIIASDIHGAADYLKVLMDLCDATQPDRVVLLGDLLYHGPRNDLPHDYRPKEVLAMLNSIKDEIIAVRGNCEAEVDQMVLDFPCMAEYSVLWDPTATNPITNEIGRELFLTHGHIWGAGMQNSIDKPPALQKGGVLVYGHTHVKVNGPADKHPDILCFNPGSVGLPKDGSHSCGIYEDGVFTHHILEL